MRPLPWLVLVFCLTNAACGFKGPLKLPDSNPPAKAAQQK